MKSHGHEGLGLSLRRLADELASGSLEALEARCGKLIFVINAAQLAPPEGPAVTQGFDTRSMAVGVTHTAFPLCKVGVNELPFISIGRTRNNDVWIFDRSLSKFQAYLVSNDAAELRLYDAGSTHGTLVDGKPAPKRGGGEPLLLRPGSIVKFGQLAALVWATAQVRDWKSLAGKD